MADAKISQLPVASTPLAGTELVPVVQGGATEQTTVEAILTGTVPSGTADGVLYLNGSKVVTSGSALTFDGSTFSNVQGSGTAALSFNQLSFSRNGANYLTATLSSLNYGANQHIFGNNDLSSEWMRLTSTGLGIGTDNPGAKLEIAQSADTTDGPKLRIANNGNTLSNGQLIGGIDFFDGDDSGEGVGAYIYSYTTDSIGRSVGQDLRFATGATETMRLDSSGNLGLGVTPSAWATYTALQTGWSALAGYAAADTALFSNAYFDGGYKYIGNGFASQYRQINSSHQWFTAPSGTAGAAVTFTERVKIGQSEAVFNEPGNDYDFRVESDTNTHALFVEGSSGNVGIGTSSPVSKLSIVGSVRQQDAATETNALLTSVTGSTSTIETRYGTPLIFGTNATERARIDASGNLGLGVTPTTGGYGKGFQFSGDPASDLGTLWIQPINTNDHRVSLTNNAKNSGVGSWAYFASSQSATMYEQVAGQHRWTTAGTGTAGNAISFTQAMTLTANGNLLVGATALPSASVEGICFTGTTSGNFSSSGASTAAYNHLLFYNGNGIVGSISTTGSATTYSTSSDYRLKNITGPITTSGAYIDSLNPVEGTWKADGSTFVGLIAHEVQEASRTTVATGVKDGEEMQGMDYSSAEIIANLIAEVKSLRQRLTAAGI
jgi:hypothetical protein